jgi:hypothetical protein
MAERLKEDGRGIRRWTDLTLSPLIRHSLPRGQRQPELLRPLLGHESFAIALRYTRVVDTLQAINEREEFVPLIHLYREQNHNHENDGWG